MTAKWQNRNSYYTLSSFGMRGRSVSRRLPHSRRNVLALCWRKKCNLHTNNFHSWGKIQELYHLGTMVDICIHTNNFHSWGKIQELYPLGTMVDICIHTNNFHSWGKTQELYPLGTMADLYWSIRRHAATDNNFRFRYSENFKFLTTVESIQYHFSSEVLESALLRSCLCFSSVRPRKPWVTNLNYSSIAFFRFVSNS